MNTKTIVSILVLVAGLLIASSAHAQMAISEEGVTFPDNSVQTTATHTSYAIGDIGPGGGIVFYVTALGFHGLEAAPANQDSAAWCSLLTDIDGIENLASSGDEDPNSGSRNTPLIVTECGDTTAAGVAANYVWPNGQTDGFLPNKEELDLMYQKEDDIGGFIGGEYWSSSEGNGVFAWLQFFGLGDQFGGGKGNTARVRAVRAF